MNAIMNVNTMTSREIAELTGKEHRNVLADIRNVLTEIHGEGGVLRFQQTYTHEQNGQSYTEFSLPKEETLILVSGYSIKMRAAIIRRWQQLESASQRSLPSNYIEALEALIESEKQKAIMAPKAEFVDKYVDATGLMGFREVAKLLKVKETKLRDFVLEKKIMYRLSGRMTPYAQHIDAGRFSVKTAEADNGHAFTQSKFTPKGVSWIAGLLNGGAS